MPPPGHLFDADYCSDRAPAGTPVRVCVGPAGLAIERADATPLMIWPYAGLACDREPPSAASVKVIMRSVVAPGAMLAVEDADFVAALSRATAHLEPQRGKGTGWMAMVGVSLAVVAVVGAMVGALLAFFPYKWLAGRIPEETRARIGQLALAEVTSNHKRCEAAAGISALNKLVDRLSKVSGHSITFKVQVVDGRLDNAFAVPGNQIVLTAGLLRAATSPDEVAGVIGHEMGHVIEMHPETSALRALGTKVALQLLFGGWSPDLVTAAAGRVLSSRYGRSSETEAEDVAQRLLKEARIAVATFAGMREPNRKAHEWAKPGGIEHPFLIAAHFPMPDRTRRAPRGPLTPSTPALDTADWAALRKICG